jgi:hypothetical protein
MRLARFLLPATIVLPACGAPTHPSPTTPLATARGDRGTRPAGVLAPSLVRAVESTPMPICEAGDLNALATLSEGVPAQPAIASHEHGALVAFVTDAQHDGSRELMLATVDAQGALRGSPTRVDTGNNPAHPALAPLADGYVLAWREGQPGQERIVARRVASDGTVQNTAVGTDGVGTGWLGAPAIATHGDSVAIAVARSTNRPADLEARRADRIDWSAGPLHASAEAPNAGLFDAERAPQLAFVGDRPRIFATAMAASARPGDARDWIEIVTEPSSRDHVRGVLESASSPRVFTTDGGALLASWRAPVAAHDVAIRTWSLEGDTPPLTVATFRGAYDAESALLPLGERLYGVFTLSTLADDDGGTLNVSVVTDRVQPVGRQPLLVSSLVRSAAVIAASTSDRHLFVLEGRADNGRDAVLGIAPVQCSIGNHADPLQIPPAGLVQRLASLDEPSAQLAHPTGTCTVVAAPQTAVTHHASRADVVADTDARIVSLGTGAVIFAIAREQDHGPTHLVVRGVDARGTLGAPTASLDAAKRILAAGRSGGAALALVAHGGDVSHPTSLSIVTSRATGRVSAPSAVPLVDATSAVLTDDGRALFVAASSDRNPGDHGLFRIPLANGRAGAPSLIVPLAPGDDVFDAVHSGRETTTLLARPDELGASISRALAITSVPDDGAAAARQATRIDPFADPRGHGRGTAWLARGANGLAVVYSEANYVRTADLDHGAIRHPRSALLAYEGGGALVARERGADATWLAIASGLPADTGRVIAPISLVSLGTRGEIRIVASDVAAADRMIAGRASIARVGDRLAMLYAQPAGDAAANWRIIEVACREGAAPPSASSSPPPSSPPASTAAPATNGAR